jgi:hypothetical protein
MDELEKIKAWIRAKGPTEAARLTGITRRALQYIANGKSRPSYNSMEALRAAMAVKKAA